MAFRLVDAILFSQFLMDLNDMKVKMAQFLKEINSDFQDSDMLIDFCGVMMENEKPINYIKEQLLDCKSFANSVTTPEETELISQWLLSYIDKPQKKDLRNMLNRKKADKKHRQSPYKRPEKEEKLCQFYPNCIREDCPFVHSTEPRKEKVASCKFGANCTKPECTFSHPSPAMVKNLLLQTNQANISCKFFPNCLNPTCPFIHPAVPDSNNQDNPMVQDVSESMVSNTVCRFDPHCKRYGCHFQHPSRNKSRNKVLIVNNNPNHDNYNDNATTSNRLFAIGDLEQVGMEVDA
jgi:hypothetical protein